MPKISTSLAIAFAVHILIITIVNFLVARGPKPLLLDTKNTINLQIGNSGIGGTSKKSSMARARPVLSSQAGPTTNSIDKSRDASENSKSLGSDNENGNVPGSGNGNAQTYDFDNSAVSYKEPVYPRMAIKRELQGSVRIRVKVSPEGKPTNTEILKSSGHEILDKAALEAVSFWQFQPKEISYFVEKTIIFQLKN